MAAVLLVTGACSEAISADQLEVGSAWVRPTGVGANTAVYFELRNSGASDILLGAHCEAAEVTMIHRSQLYEDGTVGMEHIAQLEIPRGGQILFEPGGLHVMLVNLKSDLVGEETLSFTLIFENAGEVEVEAVVDAR